MPEDLPPPKAGPPEPNGLKRGPGFPAKPGPDTRLPASAIADSGRADEVPAPEDPTVLSDATMSERGRRFHAGGRTRPEYEGGLRHNFGTRGTSITLDAGSLAVGEVRTERAYEHAPTWSLDFRNETGTIGQETNVHVNGFEYRLASNAKRQDALAISADQKRFATSDGLGSAFDEEATAFLAKFISDAAVVQGIDALLDGENLLKLYDQYEQEFAETFGRPIEKREGRPDIQVAAAATLNYVELLSNEDVRIATVGDSPAFVLGPDGTIITQHGEDAQSGSPDGKIAFKFGLRADGTRIIPRKGEVVRLGGKSNRELHIVDVVEKVRSGHTVSICTDYFSDVAHFGNILGKTNFGKMGDYIGLDSQTYKRRTKTYGKADDATIITIDPSRLALHA
jgi:hypothetical protein